MRYDNEFKFHVFKLRDQSCLSYGVYFYAIKICVLAILWSSYTMKGTIYDRLYGMQDGRGIHLGTRPLHQHHHNPRWWCLRVEKEGKRNISPPPPHKEIHSTPQLHVCTHLALCSCVKCLATSWLWKLRKEYIPMTLWLKAKKF